MALLSIALALLIFLTYILQIFLYVLKILVIILVKSYILIPTVIGVILMIFSTMGDNVYTPNFQGLSDTDTSGVLTINQRTASNEFDTETKDDSDMRQQHQQQQQQIPKIKKKKQIRNALRRASIEETTSEDDKQKNVITSKNRKLIKQKMKDLNINDDADEKKTDDHETSINETHDAGYDGDDGADSGKAVVAKTIQKKNVLNLLKKKKPSIPQTKIKTTKNKFSDQEIMEEIAAEVRRATKRISK